MTAFWCEVIYKDILCHGFEWFGHVEGLLHVFMGRGVRHNLCILGSGVSVCPARALERTGFYYWLWGLGGCGVFEESLLTRHEMFPFLQYGCKPINLVTWNNSIWSAFVC